MRPRLNTRENVSLTQALVNPQARADAISRQVVKIWTGRRTNLFANGIQSQVTTLFESTHKRVGGWEFEMCPSRKIAYLWYDTWTELILNS